jgi:F0F1-type ATP synthase assembly protein I
MTSSMTPDRAQAAFGMALRFLFWLVGALAVVGGAVGFVVDGWSGVASALVGVGLALFFSGTTVISVQRTASHPPAQMAMVIMGAWVLKMLVMFVVLAVVSRQSWLQPVVLGLVATVGVIGSAVLDARAISRARIPYLDPDAGAGDADSLDSDGADGIDSGGGDGGGDGD